MGIRQPRPLPPPEKCPPRGIGIERPTSPPPPKVDSKTDRQSPIVAIQQIQMYRVVSDLNYEVGYLLGSLMGMRYLEPEEIKAAIDRVLEDHAKLEQRRHKMPD